MAFPVAETEAMVLALPFSCGKLAAAGEFVVGLCKTSGCAGCRGGNAGGAPSVTGAMTSLETAGFPARAALRART
ncbi:hypothetical protein NSE01_35580 [Novosphingobium sediminis]|uniref:Uncharacterized protein n=1 Tax=Novosphingobium sediminis TaxID=707214 RepID=A0A512APU6_9SPHN|nr:hypothetical protein NSE01_35580 [Novosphingobium sediminis]